MDDHLLVEHAEVVDRDSVVPRHSMPGHLAMLRQVDGHDEVVGMAEVRLGDARGGGEIVEP
ncbi:MAG: hypothetical protein AAGD06_28915, partial [Acidobacteriota bacterium]